MRVLLPVILAFLVSACGGETADRERIFPNAESIQPLFEGMPAPAFTVRRPDGSKYAFQRGERDRPVVIIFYRGGWCPYCSAQLMELRHIEGEIDVLGYEQVYLSADSPETLQRGLQDFDEPFEYEILSDNDLRAAKKFGIAFRVDDETISRYLEHGIDLEKSSGRDHLSLPVPAVFIVNTQGVLSFAYVNPDYRYRLHPDVLAAAARVALDSRNVRERASDQDKD